MLQAEAKKRQQATRACPGERIGARPGNITGAYDQGESRQIEGKALQVGASSIDRAVHVKRSDEGA